MEYLAFIIAYLIGSINGSIIISKILNIKDIRQHGSKNPGSTNMLRTNGKKPALLAFIIDYSKAIIAMIILKKYNTHISAFGLILGHVFPIYHQFKGGKGVAVTAGIITMISLKLAVIAAISWLISLKITKISALAATISSLITLIVCFTPISSGIDVYAVIIPILIILACHKSNYKKIFNDYQNSCK